MVLMNGVKWICLQVPFPCGRLFVYLKTGFTFLTNLLQHKLNLSKYFNYSSCVIWFPNLSISRSHSFGYSLISLLPLWRNKVRILSLPEDSALKDLSYLSLSPSESWFPFLINQELSLQSLAPLSYANPYFSPLDLVRVSLKMWWFKCKLTNMQYSEAVFFFLFYINNVTHIYPSLFFSLSSCLNSFAKETI